MKPFGDIVELKKGECVGHVQKRLGRRLRNLKKEFWGKNVRWKDYRGKREAVKPPY